MHNSLQIKSEKGLMKFFSWSFYFDVNEKHALPGTWRDGACQCRGIFYSSKTIYKMRGGFISIGSDTDANFLAYQM